jgi:hypothetical protein
MFPYGLFAISEAGELRFALLLVRIPRGVKIGF